MKEILLIGGGGHCKSVIDIIEAEKKFRIVGIVEKYKGESSEVLGYPLIATDDDLEMLRKKYDYALITVGQIHSNNIRVKLYNRLKELDFQLPTIISPFAYVSRYAEVGEGTVVMHHALINANAKVGKNSIINSKALIEHDVIVENHVHISTNATINGGVVVKEHSFVGSGVVTKEYIEVSGFVKAGSLVR